MGEEIEQGKDIKADDFKWYGASSAGNDSYAITIGGCGASYEIGRIYAFKADVANTGACTLNINGIGAVAIKKGSADLETGDIAVGQIMVVAYDGAYFQLIQGALTQLAQTINGIKTFASIPLGPASDPTTDNQLARKKYIDDRVGAGAYACGVGTEYVNNTGAETVDQTVTVGFQPRLIKLHYFVQGYWGGMGIYGLKGIAIFSGTTLIANIPILGKIGTSNQGSKLSGDNGNLSEDSYNNSFDPSVIASVASIQGGASGSNNGSWIVVTINSISATGFVLRCVVSKDQYYTATQRFKFFWEAFR